MGKDIAGGVCGAALAHTFRDGDFPLINSRFGGPDRRRQAPLVELTQERDHNRHILRRQQQCMRIHALGPRVLYELVDEIDRNRSYGEDLDRRVARFAEADPDLLAVIGADRFPTSPLRVVRGGR